jgi:hypothetical protein
MTKIAKLRHFQKKINELKELKNKVEYRLQAQYGFKVPEYRKSQIINIKKKISLYERKIKSLKNL